MPEKMEKAIREMPRDAEVIELLKKRFRGGPAFRAITNYRTARPDPLASLLRLIHSRHYDIATRPGRG